MKAGVPEAALHLYRAPAVKELSYMVNIRRGLSDIEQPSRRPFVQ